MSDLAIPASFAEKFARLRAHVEELPPVHCPVRNLFGPSVYLRECTIPAGTTCTGAAHKHAHFCIVTRGRIVVATENGDREFVAGDIFLSQPGDQRAGYAVEDTVWITVHPNPDDETDLAVIVPRLVHATVEQLQGGAANTQALNHQGETPCLS